MQVTFEMNVPMENMQDNSPSAMLTVVAEVVNQGLPNEMVFFRNISGNATVVLWQLRGSSELHVQAQTLASQHAAAEIKQKDLISDEPIMIDFGRDHVVNVSEEVLA